MPWWQHKYAQITDFLDVGAEIQEGLQYAFQTKSKYTCLMSGSGHSGMEALITNLLEPGETIVVGNHGIWGERVLDIAERFGGMSFDCSNHSYQLCHVNFIIFAIAMNPQIQRSFCTLIKWLFTTKTYMSIDSLNLLPELKTSFDHKLDEWFKAKYMTTSRNTMIHQWLNYSLVCEILFQRLLNACLGIAKFWAGSL